VSAYPTPPTGIDLSGLIGILRRRWLVLVVCTLMGVVVGYLLASSQTPVYEATSKIYFANDALQSELSGVPSQVSQAEVNLPGSVIQTDLALVHARPVAEEVGRELRTGQTADQLLNDVRAQQDGLSFIVDVIAREHKPAPAALLANTWAQVFIRYQRQRDVQNIHNAVGLVEAQLADNKHLSRFQRRQLSDRLQRLQALSATQAPSATITENAVSPGSPVSPRKGLSAVIGLFLGLLVGVVMALLRQHLDRRMSDVDEIEAAFDLPILGTVPSTRAFRKAERHDPDAPSPPETEAFRILRANMRYFNAGRDIRSVLITSASVGEGKTTTARYLAIAAAEAGINTLLLEADLRNPQMATIFGVPEEPGLDAVLEGTAEPREVVHHVPIARRENGQGAHTLDLIVGGEARTNGIGLLESERMRRLIYQLEQRYGLVVIDSAPIGEVSDAIPLLNRVSGLIIVSSLHLSTRDSAYQLREQLDNLKPPVLGVVANRLTVDSKRYYAYRYYYHRSNGRRAPTTAAEPDEKATPPHSLR
jgi:capsular exopolysaccharide synthesis family protein